MASKGWRVPNNWKSTGTMLATVAGSALALATNANAGIIYSGVQNLTVSLPNGGPAVSSAALNGLAPIPWDIRVFNALRSGRSTASAQLHEVVGHGDAFMAMSSFSPNALKLASGDVISAGKTFVNRSFPLLRRKNLASYTGAFLNSSVGFVGIKFNLSGNAHFGWIRLHVDIGPGTSITEKAIDWAYNDVAGQQILAGQGATPEPSTFSLGLLAAGAAGVLAWRKRRKQIAA